MSVQSEPATPAAASERAGGDLFRVLAANVRQYGMLVALLVIVVFFQFTTSGVMLKPLNVTNLLLQNGYVIVMALGMLLVIVIGHIDLSVGSVAGFTGAIAAVAMTSFGLDPILAVIVTLILGGVIGAWHGMWIAYMRIPSFIVTLAGMLLFRGLTLWMLGGQPVGPFDESFRSIASGFVPGDITIPDPFGTTPLGIIPLGGEPLNVVTLVLGAFLSALIVVFDWRSRQEQVKYGFGVSPRRQWITKSALIVLGVMFITYRIAGYKGLPIVGLLALVLTGAYMFLTLRTVLGRRIYAVGGNAKAAVLSGVNAKRMVFLTFINMGVLAALGGIVIAARLNSATPKAGYGFELDVIAATFVGGASAYGGVGTVAGTLIGALFFGVLNIGMGIMSIPIDYQFAIKALVLIAAVYFDVSSKKDS